MLCLSLSSPNVKIKRHKRLHSNNISASRWQKPDLKIDITGPYLPYNRLVVIYILGNKNRGWTMVSIPIIIEMLYMISY